MKKLFSLHKNEHKLALLIDPDWAKDRAWLNETLTSLEYSNFNIILIGGSLVNDPDSIDLLIDDIKSKSDLPVYLFPGNAIQISKKADGILFISLISGRNSDYLIGQHVISAPLIKAYSLNVIPTGYMIVGDSNTSAHYMSQTQAIPYNKIDIALATAMAGEMLGMKAIYVDGGSGPDRSPSSKMIQKLSQEIKSPIIVGGGIQNRKQIDLLFESGANLIVVGTAVEKDPKIVQALSNNYSEQN